MQNKEGDKEDAADSLYPANQMEATPSPVKVGGQTCPPTKDTNSNHILGSLP